MDMMQKDANSNIMKNLVELTKEEAIQIEGGSIYRVGYAIGAWCANAVDWVQGLWSSF